MNYIKIGDTLYPAEHYCTIPSDGGWDRREARQFTLTMTSAEAMEIFVGGVEWALVRQRHVVGGDGETQTVSDIVDQSEFSVAGAVTDNRDGTSTIKMGKPTQGEVLSVLSGGAALSMAEAAVCRQAISADANKVERTDEEALAVRSIYPHWEDLIGQNAEVGFRFTCGGKLFRVRTQHVFSEQWIPGDGTESLYTVIDESHAGTLEDPIPYEGNMELKQGLYYSQSGVVYLCTRDSGQPVTHALVDLVGLYVEVTE